jgi:hypothetical protein
VTSRATLIFTIAAIVAPATALADTPKYLATHPGQPEVAVFEFESGPKKGTQEGYAIGCEALGRIWGRVPKKALSSAQFSAIRVVADIPCDSRTLVFGLGTSMPNQYVLRHRDGVSRRHPISHPLFVHATGRAGGDTITEAELSRRYADVGTPFNTKVEDFCVRERKKVDAYPHEYQTYVEGNVSRFNCGANGPRTSADRIEVVLEIQG